MNLQTFFTNILTFLNEVLVPFLLAVAFVAFVINAVRYFIIGGSNEDSQEKARSLAVWSVAGFVIIASLWGIVNMLVNGLGFDQQNSITPDYMQSKNFFFSNDRSYDP